MSIRAAVIGCGKRGELHARGLAAMDGVEVVACVDPAQDLAQKLASSHRGQAFAETGAMLAAIKPDVVALCTRPRVRLGPVHLCAEAGVKAIQSEKPMAVSWDEAREMHRVCTELGTQLTFTHQRRFRQVFAKAKKLIGDGAIGEIEQVEGMCNNFFDWGTHWFDMFFYFLDDIKAKWVLGQADCSEDYQVFDVPLDVGGVCCVQYETGVKGVLLTGPGDNARTGVRARGTDGLIEVFPSADMPFRMLRSGGTGKWEDPPLEIPGMAREQAEAVAASLRHTVECMQSGQEPLHGSAKALQATELIYATYASAQRHARIDLPMGEDAELTLDRLVAA